MISVDVYNVQVINTCVSYKKSIVNSISMGISNKVLVHVKQCPNCVHQSKTCTLACYSYVF